MSAPSYALSNTTVEPDALVAAMTALQRGGALDAVSLQLEDPSIPYETWCAVGSAVAQIRKASKWWIGDWYIFGGIAYGEDKAAAAEALSGLSAHQLANVVRTCMYVARSRRRLNLSFTHHSEVARLMPEEQDKWLRLADEGGWSRDKLREEIRSSASKAMFDETEPPQWEGAITMRRQLDVEIVAKEIWLEARPSDLETHYLVERDLIFRLGEALGVKEDQK